MVWEVAELTIKPGWETAFEAAAAKAKPLFEKAEGCSGMQIQRSVEWPNRYLLVVEWATVEHHTVKFRNSPDFQEWRRLVGDHFAAPPAVQHTQKVV